MKEYKIVGEHLTKQYKNRKVVNDVSMHVVNGEIYGLVGPNGAGKSTMLKMLLNLTKPDMGEFTIDGVSVQKNGYQTLRKVGAIIENPYFYEQITRAFFYKDSNFTERTRLIEEHVDFLSSRLKQTIVEKLYDTN